MEKSIDNALMEILPGASHGFCVFHIMKNVKKQHHTSLDAVLFKEAKASNIDDNNSYTAQIKSLHELLGNTLMGQVQRSGLEPCSALEDSAMKRRTWPSQ